MTQTHAKRKKRTFYCENCKKQVPSRARICPHCGRFFSAIRCPKCSFTGGLRSFKNGCPGCGYLGQIASPDAGEQKEGFTFSFRRSPVTDRTFPRWIYTVLTFFLLCILGIILFLYLRLVP